MHDNIIIVDWPAPKHIHAYSSTRLGGVSQGCYHSLNLSIKVGDNLTLVNKNRMIIQEKLKMPSTPLWLQQIHGIDIVDIQPSDNTLPSCDGVITHHNGVVLAIATADCVPVLLTDSQGNQIAAIHAGWRGLHKGIIAQSISRFKAPPEELMAWIGPCISERYYEVGSDVYEAFSLNHKNLDSFFEPFHQKWKLSLYKLACYHLKENGVTQIFGLPLCTYEEETLFFSHRRDHAKTGRMATFIWKN